MLSVPALIQKKKKNEPLSFSEIRSLVLGFVEGSVPDYQMAAWLMAVCWRGLTPQETADLTQIMLESGARVQFPKSAKRYVDKHSTGGVGDKTSLIIGPIVSAAGVPVPMMAGRGLGHTGGTLDKLESLNGFRVDLSLQEFQRQVETLGLAIMGQTKDMCPADRKLYALRDVTSTVDSIPLICASIMSKKLAEGLDALVLDVKFGSGAFMKTLPEARELAQNLIHIGTAHNKQVRALLTSMDQPLGRFIGNRLEVHECWEILSDPALCEHDPAYQDTLHLSLELSAHMLSLSHLSLSLAEARKVADSLWRSGQARNQFIKLVESQGGSLSQLMQLHAEPTQTREFLATKSGYIAKMDVEKLGRAAIELGAGRKTLQDKVDPKSGIEMCVRLGKPIERGAPLLKLYFDTRRDPSQAEHLLKDAFTISPNPVSTQPLIAEIV